MFQEMGLTWKNPACCFSLPSMSPSASLLCAPCALLCTHMPAVLLLLAPCTGSSIWLQSYSCAPFPALLLSMPVPP